MATFSGGSDSEGSSSHAGETRGGSDAKPAIGTLGPHYLSSAGVEGEGGNLDSNKGGGDEIAESMSFLPLGEEGKKHKDEEKDKVEEKKDEDLEEEKDEDLEEKEDEEQGEEKKDEEQEQEKKDEEKKDEEKKEEKKDDSKDKKLGKKLSKEEANQNALLLLTTLLLMSIPVLVWRSINQPELILWRLSLVICSCCVIWSFLLDVGMGPQTMLPVLSSIFFLALYADAMQDTSMGALLAHLSSYFAVGMLGYALTERRQRDGTEVSAAAAIARKPSDESKAEDLLYYQTLGAVFITLVTLGFAVPLAWKVWDRANCPIEELINFVFLPVSGLLMLWIILVGGMLLRGALIQEGGLLSLLLYFVFAAFLFTMVSVFNGQIGAMVFISLVMLGFPGLFGYSLRIYTSFKLRLELQLNMDESTKKSATRSSPEKAGESLKLPSLECYSFS